MHEGQSARAHDAVRMLGGFTQSIAVQYHFCPVRTGVFDLHKGSVAGHHDRRRNSQTMRMIGHGLAMIAGRHRTYTICAFRAAQLQQPIERTAFLERGRKLQIFKLDVELRASEFRQGARVQAGRDEKLIGDALLRCLHILDGNCEGHRCYTPPVSSGERRPPPTRSNTCARW